MKKIIVAINNKKILNKIKEINNLKIILKNVQYREAILEILKKEGNIDFIFIDEKLSGEISIEDLINKIKIINKKINIIFFLEKIDIKKENKLKKLGIKNIYFSNKINLNKILNLLEKNKYKNIKTSNKNSKNLINKKDKYNNINKKHIENKIITIYGKPKSGKSTIINLLIIYLIEKNKKILLINLNKKFEKNHLIILNKKYLENNISEKKQKINNTKNEKIIINKNLTLVNNFEKRFENLEEKNVEEKLKIFTKNFGKDCDYILFNIGYSSNKILNDKIIEKSDKKVVVISENLLGISEIKQNINNKEKTDSSLHIIQNKYYFNSISYLIFKNIFNNFCNVHKIFYNKNFINLNQKILKKEKIKIKKSTKKILKKILN